MYHATDLTTSRETWQKQIIMSKKVRRNKQSRSRSGSNQAKKLLLATNRKGRSPVRFFAGTWGNFRRATLAMKIEEVLRTLVHFLWETTIKKLNKIKIPPAQGWRHFPMEGRERVHHWGGSHHQQAAQRHGRRGLRRSGLHNTLLTSLCPFYSSKSHGWPKEDVPHRRPVLRIRIRRIRMFLGLLDPDPFSQRYGSGSGFFYH